MFVISAAKVRIKFLFNAIILKIISFWNKKMQNERKNQQEQTCTLSKRHSIKRPIIIRLSANVPPTAHFNTNYTKGLELCSQKSWHKAPSVRLNTRSRPDGSCSWLPLAALCPILSACFCGISCNWLRRAKGSCWNEQLVVRLRIVVIIIIGTNYR